jgi:anti-sigma regulatory factor (Ser/Thr protein kinase)
LGIHEVLDGPPIGSVDMTTVETTLPSMLAASRIARTSLRETLRSWDLDRLTDVALLLASELVNNAVLHVASPSTMRLSLLRNSIRVELDDASVSPPTLDHADEADEHGRGIFLVATVSDHWGYKLNAHGKTIWFELDTSASFGDLHGARGRSEPPLASKRFRAPTITPIVLESKNVTAARSIMTTPKSGPLPERDWYSAFPREVQKTPRSATEISGFGTGSHSNSFSNWSRLIPVHSPVSGSRITTALPTTRRGASAGSSCRPTIHASTTSAISFLRM